jgi:hypothetical protein
LYVQPGGSISEAGFSTSGDGAGAAVLQQSVHANGRGHGGLSMSINYRFTDHGSIFVWCGDDWVEILLP